VATHIANTVAALCGTGGLRSVLFVRPHRTPEVARMAVTATGQTPSTQARLWALVGSPGCAEPSAGRLSLLGHRRQRANAACCPGCLHVQLE
jgi:hypothetical protein